MYITTLLRVYVQHTFVCSAQSPCIGMLSILVINMKVIIFVFHAECMHVEDDPFPDTRWKYSSVEAIG